MAPLGAKGVGEPPCISSTPAIVAAIRDAIGRDLSRVPVRPADICLRARLAAVADEREIMTASRRSAWKMRRGRCRGRIT